MGLLCTPLSLLDPHRLTYAGLIESGDEVGPGQRKERVDR